MDTSGNRAAAARTHVLAEIFAVAAHIENLHACLADAIQHALEGRHGLFAWRRLEVCRLNRGSDRGEYRIGQALKSAIEHHRGRVAEILEQPETARRSHSGILFVKNNCLASGKAERREDPFELRRELFKLALAGIV